MHSDGLVKSRLQSFVKCLGQTKTGWWFGSFFIFPYIGNVIIPTDELIFIFFRGVELKPPTRYNQPMINLTTINHIVYENIYMGNKRWETIGFWGLTCFSDDGKISRLKKTPVSVQMNYHLLMTNNWKITMLLRTVNHLSIWNFWNP